nr:uncharacterized protein LOC106678112 [Halyomorpha halys]
MELKKMMKGNISEKAKPKKDVGIQHATPKSPASTPQSKSEKLIKKKDLVLYYNFKKLLQFKSTKKNQIFQSNRKLKKYEKLLKYKTAKIIVTHNIWEENTDLFKKFPKVRYKDIRACRKLQAFSAYNTSHWESNWRGLAQIKSSSRREIDAEQARSPVLHHLIKREEKIRALLNNIDKAYMIIQNIHQKKLQYTMMLELIFKKQKFKRKLRSVVREQRYFRRYIKYRKKQQELLKQLAKHKLSLEKKQKLFYPILVNKKVKAAALYSGSRKVSGKQINKKRYRKLRKFPEYNYHLLKRVCRCPAKTFYQPKKRAFESETKRRIKKKTRNRHRVTDWIRQRDKRLAKRFKAKKLKKLRKLRKKKADTRRQKNQQKHQQKEETHLKRNKNDPVNNKKQHHKRRKKRTSKNIGITRKQLKIITTINKHETRKQRHERFKILRLVKKIKKYKILEKKKKILRHKKKIRNRKMSLLNQLIKENEMKLEYPERKYPSKLYHLTKLFEIKRALSNKGKMKGYTLAVLVNEIMHEITYNGQTGYILEGYPRNAREAAVLYSDPLLYCQCKLSSHRTRKVSSNTSNINLTMCNAPFDCHCIGVRCTCVSSFKLNKPLFPTFLVVPIKYGSYNTPIDWDLEPSKKNEKFMKMSPYEKARVWLWKRQLKFRINLRRYPTLATNFFERRGLPPIWFPFGDDDKFIENMKKVVQMIEPQNYGISKYKSVESALIKRRIPPEEKELKRMKFINKYHGILMRAIRRSYKDTQIIRAKKQWSIEFHKFLPISIRKGIVMDRKGMIVGIAAGLALLFVKGMTGTLEEKLLAMAITAFKRNKLGAVLRKGKKVEPVSSVHKLNVLHNLERMICSCSRRKKAHYKGGRLYRKLRRKCRKHRLRKPKPKEEELVKPTLKKRKVLKRRLIIHRCRKHRRRKYRLRKPKSGKPELRTHELKTHKLKIHKLKTHKLKKHRFRKRRRGKRRSRKRRSRKHKLRRYKLRRRKLRKHKMRKHRLIKLNFKELEYLIAPPRRRPKIQYIEDMNEPEPSNDKQDFQIVPPDDIVKRKRVIIKLYFDSTRVQAKNDETEKTSTVNDIKFDGAKQSHICSVRYISSNIIIPQINSIKTQNDNGKGRMKINTKKKRKRNYVQIENKFKHKSNLSTLYSDNPIYGVRAPLEITNKENLPLSNFYKSTIKKKQIVATPVKVELPKISSLKACRMISSIDKKHTD